MGCAPELSTRCVREYSDAAPQGDHCYMLATFLQKFARLSVPPNSVVKIVESAIRMCPLRVPLGGSRIRPAR